jgi:hypothetical protein
MWIVEGSLLQQIFNSTYVDSGGQPVGNRSLTPHMWIVEGSLLATDL